MKKEFTPTILERDYPKGETPFCFYCEAGFVFDHKYLRQTWDHLNGNKADTRIENLVWAHWICNEEKEHNIEYQVRATEKLQENVRWASQTEPQREREGENNAHADEEELTDAEVGRITDRITKSFLDERLKGAKPKEFLLRADTRACIAFLIKKETNGRGSHQAVDRAIDNYCCSIGDYISKKEDSKRIIRIRKKEEKIC